MVFTDDGAVATLHVQVADSDAERARGLMHVTQLPSQHGMAFVFDTPTTGRFWMKDTLIPLSIAFVGEDGSIVGVREMTPCEADPCPTYGVDDPYVLAVEANRAYFDEHDIRVGARAELERA